MLNDKKIHCRIDRDSKEMIKLYKINESEFTRLSIIQVLSENEPEIIEIIIELEKIHNSLEFIEKNKKLLKEEIEKYKKQIKEKEHLIDIKNNNEKVKSNLKKIRMKSVENIKSIESRGIKPTLDMIEFNARKADMRVDSFITLLEENGVNLDHLI